MAGDGRGWAPVAFAVIATGVAAAVLGVAWHLGDLVELPKPLAPRSAPIAAPPPQAPPLPALPTVRPSIVEAPRTMPEPSFDIVRIAPSGTAVIAGSAAPGETVTVREGDAVVGTARADARGDWVVVAPIAPGIRELTLEAQGPQGIREAEASVVVGRAQAEPRAADPSASGERATSTAAAPLDRVAEPPPADFVLLVPRTTDAAPRLLTPAPTPAMLDRLASAPITPARLSIEVVDYDAEGDVLFAGLAPPGSVLRLYVGDVFAGDVIAGADGRWVLRPTASILPGRHEVRVDRLNEQGRVIGRAAIPFLREQRETGRAQAQARNGGPDAQRVVVQPGHTLWRISRETYGRGVRYTVIYAANRDQIRDPGLIYPGQVFSLPVPEAAPAPP